jgi:hypothetical protein
MGAAAEQLDEAREIVAAGVGARPFVDQVRHSPPGDVVTLPGFTAEVTQIAGRTIGQARLRLAGRNRKAADSDFS